MIIFGLLSLALVFADYHLRQMDQVRSVLTTLVAPIHIIVDMPSQVWQWADRTTTDYQTLHTENIELKAQALVLQRKLQKMTDLATENVRLRELLSGAARLDEQVTLAEIIGLDPDPFTHEVVVNKGSAEGVTRGQALVDAKGVMGQVIEVNQYTSRVMLITDPRHAVPVAVSRSGVRAIAAGQGLKRYLALQHIADTADIVEGDLLVTSGLGGRFPAGYPVAEVRRVINDPGQAFATIEVKAVAALHRSRQVLLVGQSPREEEAPGFVPTPETITAEKADVIPGTDSSSNNNRRGPNASP